MKEGQLGRFYLLPKIHKRRSNVPGRPVISNDGTATEKYFIVPLFSSEDNYSNNTAYFRRYKGLFITIKSTSWHPR